MAGNPIAILAPYVKKYAVELYLGLGIFAYVKHSMNTSNTYKSLYSKFDFQRKYQLEKLKAFISENQH